MGGFSRHWRALSALLVGAAVAAAALWLGRKPALSVVLGADVGAAVFLLTSGALILHDGEDEVRRRAAVDDESVAVIMALVLAAMACSLAALIFALRQGKAPGHDTAPWLVLLALATLVESWLVVQVLFCIHYAHLYFGDAGESGGGRGVEFQGDPPRTYRDFWYMAVCMGATFQVSDFSTTTARFRNTVTVHAMVAFAFNTLVIALGVGIVGNLLG